ncbi:type III secretion chaperone SycN [Pseudomonas entomophila]|uniref:type III secretion chaperone SycN n=1 Tax=Pseudomonas entomophila TaxID=312306 RepID=UPI001F00D1BE|nr:type III secretion chaperone SycN [Pseudomonas entomophila]MCG8291455.1 type III secretion chaperone SycN [Pseudomonas entomophila]
MDWCDEALVRFCQGFELNVPVSQRALISLQFDDVGLLQLERHGTQLTLWLVLEVAYFEASTMIERALRLTSSRMAPVLPLRCGWVGEGELLLFITLAGHQVTLSALQQAYRTLLDTRQQVLGR